MSQLVRIPSMSVAGEERIDYINPDNVSRLRQVEKDWVNYTVIDLVGKEFSTWTTLPIEVVATKLGISN